MKVIVANRKLADFEGSISIAVSAIKDSRLSFKARGILLLLLTADESAEWDDTTILKISNHSTREGRQSTQSGIVELEKLGYIQREIIQQDKSRFSKQQFLISDRPAAN